MIACEQISSVQLLITLIIIQKSIGGFHTRCLFKNKINLSQRFVMRKFTLCIDLNTVAKTVMTPLVPPAGNCMSLHSHKLKASL